MAIYVDDMHTIPLGRYQAGRGRTFKMSHMIADTEIELHDFAVNKLGLRRDWYQRDHYDITKTKRAEAVKLGAVEITIRQCALMAANRKAGYPMGTPETCIDIAKKRQDDRAARQFNPLAGG